MRSILWRKRRTIKELRRDDFASVVQTMLVDLTIKLHRINRINSEFNLYLFIA